MIFKVALIVVHDGSILFFIRLVKDSVHRFDDIVLHSLGVPHSVIQLIDCLASLTNTSFILLLQLFDYPALEFIHNFIKLTIVLFNLSFLFLKGLTSTVDLHVKNLLLFAEET